MTWSGHKSSHSFFFNSIYFSILNLIRRTIKWRIFSKLCNFEKVHGNVVGSPKLQLPNSWMFLPSGLPFSLPPERATTEIQKANAKLKAQGPEEADRQQDRLVGRSVKQSGTVITHLCSLQLELQDDQQVPVALPCGFPLETTIN